MKFILLMIGKTTSNSLIQLEDEYKRRLTHYTSFESTVIPDIKNAKNLSTSEIKEREADLMFKQIDASDEIILLDDKGKEFTSSGFSQFVEKKMMSSTKRVVFIIGGAYGFSDRIYQRANGRLSLSKMTFSHQMVRTIFLEQLYRAFTILKGEPYHHE